MNDIDDNHRFTANVVKMIVKYAKSIILKPAKWNMIASAVRTACGPSARQHIDHSSTNRGHTLVSASAVPIPQQILIRYAAYPYNLKKSACIFHLSACGDDVESIERAIYPAHAVSAMLAALITKRLRSSTINNFLRLTYLHKCTPLHKFAKVSLTTTTVPGADAMQ